MKTITIEIDAAQIADLGILKQILIEDPKLHKEVFHDEDGDTVSVETRQSVMDGERQVRIINKIEEAYAKR